MSRIPSLSPLSQVSFSPFDSEASIHTRCGSAQGERLNMILQLSNARLSLLQFLEVGMYDVVSALRTRADYAAGGVTLVWAEIHDRSSS